MSNKLYITPRDNDFNDYVKTLSKGVGNAVSVILYTGNNGQRVDQAYGGTLLSYTIGKNLDLYLELSGDISITLSRPADWSLEVV